MAKSSKVSDKLGREFLEIRARLLDIAAALDRIDRAGGAAEAKTDPRYGQIVSALGLLVDPKSHRAERVQMIFSDSV